jgi:hypothetical protein
MLTSLSSPTITINAKDTTKDEETCFFNLPLPAKRQQAGGLDQVLNIAVGAPVMLTKNLDTIDGLVNGAKGIVVGFLPENPSDETPPCVIFVQFDNQNVGKHLQKYRNQKYPLAVPIKKCESKIFFGRKHHLAAKRYQFPLALCWGCTMHKVQGLTVIDRVVCFHGTFIKGQAYVALSRIKTIEGLYLINFNEKNIVCNHHVEDILQRKAMSNPFNFTMTPQVLNQDSHSLELSILNTRSLPLHYNDVIKSDYLIHSEIILLTETWLTSYQVNLFDIEEFTVQHATHRDLTSSSKSRSGGISVYTKPNIIMSDDLTYLLTTPRQTDIVACVVQKPLFPPVCNCLQESRYT